MAVIIKIGYCHAHTIVAEPVQPRFGRDISKFAVTQIPIESVMKRIFAFAPRRLTTVQQKNVQPPVVIKVEQAYSATHRFDQVAIRGKTLKCLQVIPASAVTSENIGLCSVIAGLAKGWSN